MTGLEQLRLDAGLTRKALAVAVGVDPGTVLDVEQRRREPQAKTLAKLSSHFGVPASYLIAEVHHDLREAA